MILVDTSVWVSLFRRTPRLRLAPEELLSFVTCGPVIQEVFQGLREDSLTSAFRSDFLAVPRVGDPTPLSTYLQAADIYRQGRRRGYTLRSSTDCLIAAIAIESDVPVWHRDRDYSVIAKFTNLRIYTGTTSR